MDYITSLEKILRTLKSADLELNKDEKAKLNSIFAEADKWDKDGKACPKGDGQLNSKEYYLFSKLIQNEQSLYEKFTKTPIYKYNEDFNNLASLFLDNYVDEDFVKNCSENEIKDFINEISFEYDGWKIDKNKAKSIFNIQLKLLQDNNCYTEDLEQLVNTVLENSPNSENNINCVFDSLKKHINGRLKAKKSNKKVEIKEPNGKIDADFKQGVTGDCWLLSSIKAIASDEKGLEKLNNMLSVQKEGDKLISVTVHLQGKDYIISSEELHSAVEYSTGDLDVRALEIAANRFCLENSLNDVTAGGEAWLGYEILLGDKESVKKFSKMQPQDFALDADFTNNLKTTARVGAIAGAYPDKYAIDVKTGEKVKLVESHQYAIIGSDENFAYLSNPHDSSQKLKLAIDDILQTFTKGYLYDIS